MMKIQPEAISIYLIDLDMSAQYDGLSALFFFIFYVLGIQTLKDLAE